MNLVSEKRLAFVAVKIRKQTFLAIGNNRIAAQVLLHQCASWSEKVYGMTSEDDIVLVQAL